MSAGFLRSVSDNLGWWDGESDPICTYCQRQIREDEGVERNGEPFHRDCARILQRAGRQRARRDLT